MNNAHEYLDLQDGTTVDKALYESVQQYIVGVIPYLEPGCKYTLKGLYGPGLWNQLTNGERRKAGKYMVDIVKRKLVPLSFVGTYCDSPKRYQVNR